MLLRKETLIFVLVAFSTFACRTPETVVIDEGTTTAEDADSDNDTNATVAGAGTSATAAPTITDVSDQSIAKNGDSGAIAVAITDSDSTLTCADSFGATSSNSTLIPQSGIVVSGTAPNCSLTLTPATGQTGSATITMAVTDGTDIVTDTFTATVSNDAPTISNVSDQNITKNSNSGAVAFTIADTDDSLNCGTSLSASSTDDALVNGTTGVSFGGTAPNCTVTITPETGVSGSATLTLTVTDGSDSSTDSVAVTVSNSAPTIDDVADQNVDQNSNSGAVAFTISDSEDTLVCTSAVTATSSNETVLPNGNIVIAGASTSCTVTITPASNQTGSSTVTLTVSDGETSANDTVAVTVSNVAPTVSDVSNTDVDEGSSTSALAFTIDDEATTLDCDNVTASSSDTSVIPDDQLTIGGSGTESCTVTVGTSGGAEGTSTITLSISDGSLSGSDTFVMTVNGYCSGDAEDGDSRESNSPYANSGDTGIDGSDSNPYTICSEAQWNRIDDSTTTKGYSYSLRDDLDFSSTTFYPASGNGGSGAHSDQFRGTFEGNNKTISNVTLTHAASYTGIFGRAYGCTIQNLNIDSTNVNETIDYSRQFGILIAVGHCDFDNVHITNSDVQETHISDNAAFFIGDMSTGSSTFNNCSIASNNTWDTDNKRTGGFVGNASQTLTITNSYNAADIRARSAVGGLVGYAPGDTTITDSYNTGQIYGDTGSNVGVGGIIGWPTSANSGTLTRVYNSGEIKSAGYDTGGLIGGGSAQNMTIQYSFSSGTIDPGWHTQNGAIIGNTSSPTITHVYYDEDYTCAGTCSTSAGTGVDHGGSGVFYDSSDDVYSASKMNWNFSTTWQENSSAYPTLR